MAAEQLSGTIVVIIIAIGVQFFIMLFIFAKRQIMRFALRNRRGPHTSIGQGGPKPLRREADRCLDYVPCIRHEPQPPASNRGCHFFRVKALELYARLEAEISASFPSMSRIPGSSVRAYLLHCSGGNGNGPLGGIDQKEIHLLCDDYEHARHHYEPFGDDKLSALENRIEKMRSAVKKRKAAAFKTTSVKTDTVMIVEHHGENRALLSADAV